MRKMLLGRVLGLSLALVMGFSVPISALAQEDFRDVQLEDNPQSEDFFIDEEIDQAAYSEENVIVVGDEQDDPQLGVEDFEVVVEEDGADASDEAVSLDTAEEIFIDDGDINESVTEDGDISEISATGELSAEGKQKKNKITYKLNGAKQKKAPSFYYTGQDIQLVIPVKTGYVFNGWSIKINGKKLNIYTELIYDSDRNILRGAKYPEILNGNIELTANFAEAEYTIVICDNDGTELEEQPYGFGSEEPHKYTESIDFYDAAVQLKNEILSDIGESDAVTGFSKKPGGKADYVIGKVYSKLMPSVGELKLYPVITKRTNFINYDLEGGQLTSPVCTYKSGKKTVLPKAKKPGYIFLGWQADYYDEDSPFVYKKIKTYDAEWDEYYYTYYATAITPRASGELFLVACYKPIRYNVYLSPNGKGVKSYVYDYFKAEERIINITGKKCVGSYSYGNYDEEYLYFGDWFRDGYELVGYSTNPKATTEEECIEPDVFFNGHIGNVTLYCIWEPLKYSIEYSSNAKLLSSPKDKEDYTTIDISGYKVPDEMRPIGKEYVLPTPDYPGCTFDRWELLSLEDEGVRISKKNGKIYKVNASNVADLMFMASYIDNTYQLYLNVNGGVCSIGDNCYSERFDLGGRPINPNADAEYVTALINGLPEKLSRDGYVLRGLFLDKMGKRPIPTDYRFLSEKVGDEVTIYAVWDKK